MSLLPPERRLGLQSFLRLLGSRGTKPTLHLCNLLASVQFSGLPRVKLTDFIARLRRGSPTPSGGAAATASAASPATSVVLHPELHGFGSGSTAEMATIAALVALTRPRQLLEFGTCDGCSTWHLWSNAPADARITTLDLPANTKVEGSSDAGLQGIQARPFLPRDPRVRLVEIDSRRWTPDTPSVDFAFIDAGHSYECVRNDTEKTLSVMRPGGLVLWHDASWREDEYGVNTYLRELRAQGRDIVLLDAGPYDYCALAAFIVPPAK